VAGSGRAGRKEHREKKVSGKLAKIREKRVHREGCIISERVESFN
jgi:hypothetical protein